MRWTAERIFDELQDRGYTGGRTVVKEYVRDRRPRKEAMGEARFFVKPGQQLQVDWGEMGVVSIGGVERKLYAFVAIMAWSRAPERGTSSRTSLWTEKRQTAFQSARRSWYGDSAARGWTSMSGVTTIY